jgi:hypothetical protein
MSKKYPYLHFNRNSSNEGYDRNLLKVVSETGTKYVWPIGDKHMVLPGSIPHILHILDGKKYDILIINNSEVNGGARCVRYRQQKVFYSAGDFFRDLGWHTDLIGSTIFPSEAWQGDYVKKYLGTSFIQVGVIFEYLARLPAPCILFDPIPMTNIMTITSWWVNNPFKTFLYDWEKVINALPSLYPIKDKEFVIRAHMLNTGTFNFTNLYDLKRFGYFDYPTFLAYRDRLNKYSSTNSVLASTISLMPRFIIKDAYMLKKLPLFKNRSVISALAIRLRLPFHRGRRSYS